MQAIADSDGRFLYCNVGHVKGSSHDSFVWKQDALNKRILDPTDTWHEKLTARGHHLIGDDAYPAGITMSVPWPGKHSREDPRLAYNYYHSSARIRIECAFGMLCRKWLILKRPWEGSLEATTADSTPGIALTVMVCMQLHNYSIKSGSAKEYFVLPDDYASSVTLTTKAGPRTLLHADHRGLHRAIRPDVTLLSSPNPLAGQVESSETFKRWDTNAHEPIAAAEAMPAWYDDERSPRDEIYAEQARKGKKQPGLAPGRDEDTKALSAANRIRPNARWW